MSFQLRIKASCQIPSTIFMVIVMVIRAKISDYFQIEKWGNHNGAKKKDFFNIPKENSVVSNLLGLKSSKNREFWDLGQ